ncbi:FAD dependent oxidoreductase [Flavobacteria bacterium MS024-3C]|nr:FAD dependent oxidoreductase [Flavobacteria bacterium MS024-3C]MDA9272675.1 FAD-binding protein [Flavobacteriaceae bacterium]MDB4329949.1 FAD-binding protein [Flavobacteriaceae bacterium]MDB9730510.1 FAD-binding protein [Flavobacteriaceae bacterium]MDC1218381.1 FAD-binding protein [Flavobacteriaceae bacterium]
MSALVQIVIKPQQQEDLEFIYRLGLQKAKLNPNEVIDWRIRKRSLDARKASIKLNVQLEFWKVGEVREVAQAWRAKTVNPEKKVAIIGAGPAGLYAALRAIEAGITPVVFERGKDVRARRRDLAAINKAQTVNPESNYCFGEGGAGTYSDGKLYTRSKKRGNVLKALEWLVHFGASDDILVEAHPHIGTNKLPAIITAMREAVIAYGGAVHFNAKLTDIKIENNSIKGLEINGDTWHDFSEVVLATGHSARDIFYLLHKRGVTIAAKPFALGVRVEHTQELINDIQYHGDHQNPYLPPASYALVEQVNGMGVYSFCMCPGGIIAPCATEAEEVVTNGWSPSKRNNPYANSGIVVSVSPEDLPNYKENDPFVCLDFQKKVEYDCWVAGGKTQRVPAQRMIDFVQGKTSVDFPKTSYQPGIVSVNLAEVLPPLIAKRLQKAFVKFGRKMNGYYTNEAVLHAPESRTSSPVSIPRDPNTLEHIDIKGLYPCGEGAGYAGGIISAAIDGINCVDAIAQKWAL